MSTVVPVAMMALAGVLIGGAWSMHRQGAARGAVVLLSLLAVVAFAGGILWLVPDG